MQHWVGIYIDQYKTRIRSTEVGKCSTNKYFSSGFSKSLASGNYFKIKPSLRWTGAPILILNKPREAGLRLWPIKLILFLCIRVLIEIAVKRAAVYGDAPNPADSWAGYAVSEKAFRNRLVAAVASLVNCRFQDGGAYRSEIGFVREWMSMS